jgi:hypothetical protein
MLADVQKNSGKKKRKKDEPLSNNTLTMSTRSFFTASMRGVTPA